VENLVLENSRQRDYDR